MLFKLWNHHTITDRLLKDSMHNSKSTFVVFDNLKESFSWSYYQSYVEEEEDDDDEKEWVGYAKTVFV